jgi:hypothetical protein
MDNHKTHHPVNFRFARQSVETGLRVGEESFPLQVVHHADEVVHLSIGGRWAGTHSQAELTPPEPAVGESKGEVPQARLPVGPDGSIRFANAAGATLLDAAMGGSFGVSGQSWLLEFAYDPEMRFYGMGEKLGPLEKSGVRTKFWNRDVFADFAAASIEAGKTDPMYVSIPWLIIRTARGWCGILVNTPEAPFMCAGGSIKDIANQRQLVTEPRLKRGAPGRGCDEKDGKITGFPTRSPSTLCKLLLEVLRACKEKMYLPSSSPPGPLDIHIKTLVTIAAPSPADLRPFRLRLHSMLQLYFSSTIRESNKGDNCPRREVYASGVRQLCARNRPSLVWQ